MVGEIPRKVNGGGHGGGEEGAISEDVHARWVVVGGCEICVGVWGFWGGLGLLYRGRDRLGMNMVGIGG